MRPTEHQNRRSGPMNVHLGEHEVPKQEDQPMEEPEEAGVGADFMAERSCVEARSAYKGAERKEPELRRDDTGPRKQGGDAVGPGQKRMDQ